ncbi:calcium-binding protein [Streptomyces sp. NPDC001070]
MRIRSFVGAVCGALALSAFAVPAHAAENPITYSGVVVNGGKPIAVGTSAKKTFTVTYTVTHTYPLYRSAAQLYKGIWDAPSAQSRPGDATCTDVDATTARCTATLAIDPKTLIDNHAAGTWHAELWASDGDMNAVAKGGLAPTQVRRNSVLTVNAGPEPVAKGGTLTVTGKLTRANWETDKYAGYSGQSVALQFRSASSSTYTTVKTVTSSSTGALKTTVRASADGSWRFVYAGNSVTGKSTSAGDYVDVR